MKLLHLDASPRADRSRSRPVARGFLESLPDHFDITHWPLWELELPDLGTGMIEARYALIMGEKVPRQHSQAWSEIEMLCAEFLGFDGYIISTPMWNFGVPYRLKQFVDVITQPGMTFRNDSLGNVIGLAAGKPAAIFAASAMPFGKDEQLEPLDFQASYLEAWLKFIGVNRIDQVNISPTFGLAEDVAKEMYLAMIQAEALAARWAKG